MVTLLLACVRAVSPVLEVGTAAAPRPPPVEPEDPAALVEWMVADDPLVRRPRLPRAAPEALAPFVTLARQDTASARSWWEAEAAAAGSSAVPFLRGARLAALETASPEDCLEWASPLPTSNTLDDAEVRAPLAWLGTAGTPTTLVHAVERQVLLGWLDAPTLDARVAAAGLRAEWADRIAGRPIARLIDARAAAPRDRDAAKRGRDALHDATRLAGVLATAEGDAAQARARADRVEAAARVGTSADPVVAQLTTSFEALLLDAGDDESVGLALVADGALRLLDACADRPCGVLDRARALDAAARWGASPRALARAWQAIALERATDRLEASMDGPFVADAIPDLVDALALEGVALPDIGVLGRARVDAGLALTLARVTGRDDVTTPDGLVAALRAEVSRRAKRALDDLPVEARSPIDTLSRR